MMTAQMPLPLNWSHGPGADRLIITPCIEGGLRRLSAIADWPVHAAIWVAPPRSGKSLILRHFATQHDALIADDADQMADDALFHLWNRAQAERRLLLMSSRIEPADWNIALPDLRSRVAASMLVRHDPVDEAMLSALLEHHLTRRGTSITADAVDYAVRRIERSHAAVEALAEAANARSLAERRPVTLSLLRALFSDQSMQQQLDLDTP